MTFDFVKRLLGESPKSNGTGTVHCGLVYRKGSWSIVGPNVKMKGLRVVEVPTRLYDQYQSSRRQFEAIQTDLASLPYVHASNPRPKRRRPTKEEIAARVRMPEPSEIRVSGDTGESEE